MIKNTASQKIGAQLVSATDGSAFTGSVTVYITGAGGTQAAGSVGSGACAHEGEGYHTYAPAQAETNYDLIAFTFKGTGAIPVTAQVYTRAGDAFTRLGAPIGASVSADIAAAKTDIAAILADTGTDGVVVAAGSKSGYALATAPPTAAEITTAVWAATTRTLTAATNLTTDIAAAVWAATIRTLSSAADSAGVTTLLSRIASAITLAGGKVDVADKSGFSLATAPPTIDEILAAAAAVTVKANVAVDPSAIIAALATYDQSVSSTHDIGTGLLRGGSISAVSAAGPRSRTLVSALFEEVRGNLRSPGATGLYSTSLLAGYYNRILPEVWALLVQLGAEIVCNVGTLVSDGAGQDYELPADFQAFKPGGFLPRSPITATADYTHGQGLDHVGIFAPCMPGDPTRTGTPSAFAIFASGDSQFIRFNVIPEAGQRFDFVYYPATAAITADSASSSYTPWLGLADAVIKRTLEELCREGLEFMTGKREIWRARAEADLAMLLGLRHLEERKATPSIWSGRR